MKLSRILAALLLTGLMASVGMTVHFHYAGTLYDNNCALMRVGLEDVAVRVRTMAANFRTISEMANKSAESSASALVAFIVADPTVLGDQSRLDDLAKTLDVDELHVTDGKGVFVAGVPRLYLGHSLAESEQSREFLPLLEKGDGVFIQKPMRKGLQLGSHKDGEWFQYAGMRRKDAPGIVQVGVTATRVKAAQKLADVMEIAESTRIGVDGRVFIYNNAGLPPPQHGVFADEVHGRKMMAAESDCGGYRIRVVKPFSGRWMLGANLRDAFIVLDITLLLLLLVALPGTRRTMAAEVGTLKAMFGGRFRARGAFARAVRNPATVACAFAFLMAIAVGWFVMSRTSMTDAKARLAAAAADIRDAVDTCADNLLFYQGAAICRHYGKPEAMTVDMVQEVMHRYNLDELNVVDARGIVLAGALADVGYDMGSNENSAKFNCLLAGRKTYSQPFRAAIENPNGPKLKYAGVAFPPPAKGYVQLGFKEERMKSDIDYWFKDLALARHIGGKGYYIVADAETGRLLSCGKTDKDGVARFANGLTLSDIGFDWSAAPTRGDEYFTARLFGEDCLCLSEVRCFHRLVSVIPVSEIRGAGIRIVLLSAAVLLCVFVIVVFFMTKLTDLVMSLREKEREEKKRQEEDLAVSRTIQTSSLPVVFPDEPEFKVFALMDTAREVGGDFYDFYELPSGRFFFLIADVSGKGVPAAMFMMKARAILKACMFECGDFAEAVGDANDRLAQENAAEMFVTCWMGSFDKSTGDVQYVNAGHNPPLVKRADGEVSWVKGRRSVALAVQAGLPYHVASLKLAPGDSLFLYTDGVTEASDAADGFYGEERLAAKLKASGPEFVTEIRRDVAAFATGAEQSDDITMLALDFKKRPVRD